MAGSSIAFLAKRSCTASAVYPLPRASRVIRSRSRTTASASSVALCIFGASQLGRNGWLLIEAWIPAPADALTALKSAASAPSLKNSSTWWCASLSARVAPCSSAFWKWRTLRAWLRSTTCEISLAALSRFFIFASALGGSASFACARDAWPRQMLSIFRAASSCAAFSRAFFPRKALSIAVAADAAAFAGVVPVRCASFDLAT